MPVKEILLLGHPKLYKISELVQKDEIARLCDVADDLHDTLMDFKKRYGKGLSHFSPPTVGHEAIDLHEYHRTRDHHQSGMA